MVTKKQNILVVCGGPSAEHDVSLISCTNVVAALRDHGGFEVSVAAVTRDYRWLDFGQVEGDAFVTGGGDAAAVQLAEDRAKPFDFAALLGPHKAYDAVFPIIHGPFGEDGSLQGLLKCARVPFVGSSVLGSALAMDKVQSKRILHHLDIPQARYEVLYRSDAPADPASLFSQLSQKLGQTMFVKPANMGSSVGVSRARSAAELGAAVTEALRFDHKVIIEEAIAGREVECAILGNRQPKASPHFGEITAGEGFYSYKAKYLDDSIATLKLPCEVSAAAADKLHRYALSAYKGLDCLGLARVDFFVDGDNVVLNEINTLPGFTAISMYPKLWEAAGMSAPELVAELIELAQEEFAHNQQLALSAD